MDLNEVMGRSDLGLLVQAGVRSSLLEQGAGEVEAEAGDLPRLHQHEDRAQPAEKQIRDPQDAFGQVQGCSGEQEQEWDRRVRRVLELSVSGES